MNTYDFNQHKNHRKEILAIDNEEIESMFGYFFKMPMNMTPVVDENSHVTGYTAMPGKPEFFGEADIASLAANVWDRCYRGRVFAEPVGILISFMSCFSEQQEIDAELRAASQSPENKVAPVVAEFKSALTRLLNKQEAAIILGVSEKTLDNWASSKTVDLGYVKVGRLRKYRESDLQEFIDGNLHGGATV